MKSTYKLAGVDIDAAGSLSEKYEPLIEYTRTPGVIPNRDGFNALFRFFGIGAGTPMKTWRDPILVCGNDGVGTKLMIAQILDKHDTVGVDLVATNVNDVLVQGAEPLFFMDYIGRTSVSDKTVLQLVTSIAVSCREAGCALLGGETAELPEFYSNGQYELAGFCVGAVENEDLIRVGRICPGDVIIGLFSSGIHCEGFSLVRRIICDASLDLSRRYGPLEESLGEELLKPTRIYARPILDILADRDGKESLHALAFISGGGIIENIPRVLPKNCDARIRCASWARPAIFTLLAQKGNVDEREMFRTFNMGIGMAVFVDPRRLELITNTFDCHGFGHAVIGEVVAGKGAVILSQ